MRKRAPSWAARGTIPDRMRLPHLRRRRRLARRLRNRSRPETRASTVSVSTCSVTAISPVRANGPKRDANWRQSRTRSSTDRGNNSGNPRHSRGLRTLPGRSASDSAERADSDGRLHDSRRHGERISDSADCRIARIPMGCHGRLPDDRGQFCFHAPDGSRPAGPLRNDHRRLRPRFGAAGSGYTASYQRPFTSPVD